MIASAAGVPPSTVRALRGSIRRGGWWIQQRHLQLLLQPPNLVAQRWLCDVQALGSAAEMKLLRDGHEVLHQPKVQAFDRRNLLMVESNLSWT